MKFKLKEKHLELQFTWKEIFLIIIRGCFKLDRKSVYTFSTILMKIIHEFNLKYGDYREHGSFKIDEFDEKP